MKLYKVILLVLLIAGTAYIAYNQHTAPYRTCEGKIFGTYYKITYQHTDDLQEAILSALGGVDASLSMFNPESTLSKLNRGENPDVDNLLAYLFPRAMKVSEATDGAFDITVAPLVNVWGFGFKNEEWPSQQTIDSIRAFVGYEKVRMQGKKIVRDDDRTMIDLSAIAKGYGCDVVAQLLDKEKSENYMIEIGGEVVVKGESSKGELWSIGVAKPVDVGEEQSEGFQCVLSLKDCAVATSGNYRNFFYKDGVRYAHTIDPHTGYPARHSILSATIVASHCYEADAYATAFMVMGMEKAQQVLEKQSNLAAYLVYTDDKGEWKVWMTDNFHQYIR